MEHMNARHFHRCLTVFVAVCFLLLNGVATSALANRVPSVVATTAMIGDVVAEIGGSDINLTVLMGPGTDPHLYTPTRDDLIALTRADLILLNGHKLEGRMGDALRRFNGRKPVVAVAESLRPELLLRPNGGTSVDPHVWMDVEAWRHSVDVVEAELIKLLPAKRDDLVRRAAAYREVLTQLDHYARAVITSIPEPRRVLVTAHDAFGYLGRAYGIEVRGIQGLSTESEAGLRELNGLVDLIVGRGIQAVFVESTISEKNVRALVEGSAARGVSVRIGGELFSDAMGASGTWEGTYVGMIDHNVSTIARALGGQVPEGGFRQWAANGGHQGP